MSMSVLASSVVLMFEDELVGPVGEGVAPSSGPAASAPGRGGSRVPASEAGAIATAQGVNDSAAAGTSVASVEQGGHDLAVADECCVLAASGGVCEHMV